MLKHVTSLEDHTGYWLRAVSNHVSQAFAQKLADEDATVAEWVLLRLLYEQEYMPPSMIAKRMGMTKGAITKLVDRLTDKSLVVRIASPDDGRAQAVKLTPTGERLVPKLAAFADQNDKECFGHLSAKDHKILQCLLKELAAKLAIELVPTK